MERIRYALMIR